jgi:RNA polymerase sigma factor (sigma-70 family)
MQGASVPQPRSPDADLVVRARAGDRDAFAAIYDRYGDRLHDFCWSMLRNRDDAADATQDTFVRVVERLGQLRDPAMLRPWLYSIAKREALARLKIRQRQVPDESIPERADPSAGPETTAGEHELRDLVWAAAAGLGDRDRVLLDLHVRHGLDGGELAEAAGVPVRNIYVLLGRLRQQVERSMGALLVARLGRADCAELDAILTGWDGRFSALIRKRVARHVDGCDTCGERRRTAASPMALLATVPVMLAPPELRDIVLRSFDVRGSDSNGSDGSDGAAGGWWRQPGAVVAGSTALLTGGVVAGLVLFGTAADDPPAALVPVPPEVATSAPLTSPTESTPSTAGAESSIATAPPQSTTSTGPAPAGPSPVEAQAEPGRLVTSVSTLDLGMEAVDGPVELRNVGGSSLSYEAASHASWLTVDHTGGELATGSSRDLWVIVDRGDLPEGDHSSTVTITSGSDDVLVEVAIKVEHPPTIDRAAAYPEAIGTRGCSPDSASVSAVVTDESDVAATELVWRASDGSTGTSAMTFRSGSWYASLGPIEGSGSVSWQVTATDARGNSATSAPQTLTVRSCLR